MNSEEEKDFYKYIIDNSILLQAKIIDTEIIVDQNKNEYCTYDMQISTTLADYKISRRYSDFYELKKQIEKQNIKIKTFPGKKLFSDTDSKVINDRKSKLNMFLDQLCNSYIQNRLFNFLKFLDLKKQCEERNIGSFVRSRQPSIFDSNGQISYQPQNEDEKEYIKLLQDIKCNPDKLTIHFKNLRQFLFKKNPKLSSSLIVLSIRGDNDFPGLIEICGSSSKQKKNSTHLTCSIGLELLNDMMQLEQNIRADLYLEIFCKTSFRKLKKINFAYHILNEQSEKCRVEALKLLKKFIEKQQNIDRNMLNCIDINSEVQEKYEKWIGFQLVSKNFQQNQYIADRINCKSKDDMLQDYKCSFLSFQGQASYRYSTPQKKNQEEQKQKKKIEQKVNSEQQYRFPGQSITEDIQNENENQDQDQNTSENEIETQYDNLQKRSKKIINSQLKKTVVMNKRKNSIESAKEIENYIDDKSIKWETLYKYDSMKVKRAPEQDNFLQISITLKMSAIQAADLFIEKRKDWDVQLKDFEVMEVLDNNSQIMKKTEYWQKSANMAFVTQVYHQEVNKLDKSCIYQYNYPVERQIKLEENEFLGKSYGLVQIKDRTPKDQKEIQPIHKESNNSMNSADQTQDNINCKNSQYCKLKMFIKSANFHYSLYLSPLLLKENDQVINNLKNFVNNAKRKYTYQEDTIQEIEQNSQQIQQRQQQNQQQQNQQYYFQQTQ